MWKNGNKWQSLRHGHGIRRVTRFKTTATQEVASIWTFSRTIHVPLQHRSPTLFQSPRLPVALTKRQCLMMLRMLGSLSKRTRPSQPDCVVLLHSIYLSPEKPHRYFRTRKSSLFSSFWDKCEKMETNGNPYVMDMVLEGWHVLKLLQHRRSPQYEHFRVRYTYHFNIVVQRSSSHHDCPHKFEKIAKTRQSIRHGLVMDMILEGWHVLKLLQHSNLSQYEHFCVRYTYHFNIVVRRSSSHHDCP